MTTLKEPTRTFKAGVAIQLSHRYRAFVTQALVAPRVRLVMRRNFLKAASSIRSPASTTAAAARRRLAADMAAADGQRGST